MNSVERLVGSLFDLDMDDDVVNRLQTGLFFTMKFMKSMKAQGSLCPRTHADRHRQLKTIAHMKMSVFVRVCLWPIKHLC